MTKIYLTVFRNKENEIYDFEVFTNLRKAKQYKRYWDATMKIDKIFEGHKVELVNRQIMQTDFTRAANEKEMELLPY